MSDFIQTPRGIVINLNNITWMKYSEGTATLSISFIGGDTTEHDLELYDNEAKYVMSVLNSRLGIL